MPPGMVHDPDAAGPRSGVRIREPVPPGARAGAGQAGRSSDCTVHSAVVSASSRRRGRDSAAALPSSAAATTSSAAAASRACRARQEHGRGTAAAFRDGGHSGLPGGAGFGNDRPGRLAHFAGGIGRRRAGAVPGEQPQSRQPQHAPGVTLSRAMRCRHGGRARPARAKTAVRLPRIPATGRELLRAPRNAERDGARRGPDRLPGRHPPGQRSHLATDRITGSAGDLDVPPDVDSLAHKLSRNHGDGERQAGGVRAGHTAPSVNGIPRIRRKGPGAGNCARHHPVPAGAPAPRSPRPAQSAGHSR